jgi:PKD repeat protein
VSRRARRVVVAAIVVAVGGATAVAAGAAGTGGPPAGAPDIFARPQRVSDALAIAPGPARGEAARRNDMTEAQLNSHAADPTAWLDKKGRLFYVEPKAVDAASSGAVVAAAGVAPYDQTFVLHSRPGSTRKIYLDFNGHTVSGTAWNDSEALAPFWAEAYDSDGSPATFSTAEMDVVQATWQRVAEDYAPFDVDVTTEDPGYAGINRSSSTDNAFGTRLLVTSTQSIASSCGCGGIAYVGTIDSTGTTHDYYQPAFVFTAGVGNGAKNIAEAASHEVGHNAGLSHDGTASLGYYSGHAAWAPIMGVGYSKPISQWSRGEYSGANQTQDDFAVMASNLIVARADDHGGVSAPTPLAVSSTVNGVIATRTDIDAFQFTTGGGAATFVATSATTGPNLDIRLEVRDSAGVLVASADPAAAYVSASTASGLGASVTTTLAAGTYVVSVDGVGFGDPLLTGYSDYGSLGEFQLVSTFAPTGTGNQPPIARATATPSSGTAPLTVAFNGSTSSDADGTIASYAWAFGDGTTGTGVSASKVYTTVGTYTATLTVTDSAGATTSTSVVVTVSAPVVVTNLRVQTITLTTAKRNGRTTATAAVLVTDTNGTPQSGVTVTGTYSGAASGTVSGTTSSTGKVSLSSAATRSATGTFTFTVTQLAKTGANYSATNNVVSTASISF